ncbi:MAG: dynamin family protein [Deltaproteobacteria bacterium]|nr:dynamin family protein [Deltaproteobacteria bacterium]
MLEAYRQRQEQIGATLRQLAEAAAELGMRSLELELVGVRIPKLAEGRFNLVVLGEFNHGKSTFVNALLGEGILPVGITPTTATINHIVWAEAPRVRAVLRDGTAKEIPLAELADYVTLEGEHAAEIRYVELGFPADLLRDKITLVDTPGVNDINEARAEITYSYIPRADAVIFLLDGTQVLKQSERAFIQQRLLRRTRDKLLFVIGKVDLLSPEEAEETLNFARQHLAALVEDPVIFTASARRYLQGEREASGMEPLLAFLQRHLHEERGKILLDNALADAERTLAYLRSSVGLKRGTLELSVEELTERVSQVRRQLEGSRQTLSEALERIGHETEAVKATIRHDLRLFAEAFSEALPAAIDAVEATDVKRYLQFFLQDKFKEWAEQEGDKAAELLEKLAEEIIQVTNENVHAVLEAVAGRFGPGEVRVELEVDTLKYDAGVFALGALGTTIFLFMNTFVGGLLTIAAPILAVVLREKVGAQIKAQAKQHGPEVIRRGAETIRPRFEEIVDQFAERLTAFVENAGDALYKNISEVLDQALAERRVREASAEEAQGALAAQDARLVVIGAELERLRGSVWSDEGGGA